VYEGAAKQLRGFEIRPGTITGGGLGVMVMEALR
jgi:hypothetical protein